MKLQQITRHYIVLFDDTKDLSNQVVNECFSVVFKKNNEIIVYKKIYYSNNTQYIYLVFNKDHDLLKGYFYKSDGKILDINKYQILLQIDINNVNYKRLPICFFQ